MEREDVVHALRALADGVDPTTGTPLPPDHPFQRGDTVRLLCAAVRALESTTSNAPSTEPAKKPRGRSDASGGMAGKAWTVDDEQALANAYDSGTSIAELSTRFGRTRGGIVARLAKLGRIEPPASLRLRGVLPGSSTPGALRAGS
jgi:hypothetical protein